MKENRLQVATVFSGIGSAEYAFRRMGIPHDIVFACDNGDRDPGYDIKETKKTIRTQKSIRDKELYMEKIYNSGGGIKCFPGNNPKYSGIRSRNRQQEIYTANFKPKYFFQDAKLIDGRDFKNKIDILIGSSPDHKFEFDTVLGGLDDIRGTNLFEFLRIVRESQPKSFIFENVRGMKEVGRGKYWRKILEALGEFDYHIDWGYVDAKHQGIPQSRKRIFIVGFKEEEHSKNFTFPEEKPLQYKMKDFLIHNCPVGNMSFNEDGSLNIKYKKIPLNEFIMDTKVSDAYLSESMYKYVMNTNVGGYKKLAKTNSDIALTLVKRMVYGQRAALENYVSHDDVSNSEGDLRKLLPIECLRLMGFCDDFVIPGHIKKSKAYELIANSDCVDVIMSLFNSINSVVEWDDFDKYTGLVI